MNAEADHSPVKISVRNLNFFYTKAVQSLFDNNLDIRANRITAVIGPSGCGKSTHLRVYNRIFELYRGQRADGQVLIDGRNILDPAVDVLELRRKVGMIFQKPTPFPMSVFDNVAYPMRLHFKLSRSEIADRVEAELGKPLTVVATGGLAPYITPCCRRKIVYDADLLFKGLALIWEKNGK